MHVELCTPAAFNRAAEGGETVFRDLRLVVVAPVTEALMEEGFPERVIAPALQGKKIQCGKHQKNDKYGKHKNAFFYKLVDIFECGKTGFGPGLAVSVAHEAHGDEGQADENGRVGEMRIL